MVLHLHHVPGRLRVCLANLVGHSRAIIPLHSALLAVPGVRSASINAHTGSVTVLYHRADFDLEAFWATLRRQGCLSDQAGEPAPSDSADTVPTGAVSGLGQALASALVKSLFDRSALSLVKLLT
ncbi:hypothetical protein [Methylocystis iwaonis]|uniref:hypothetical protein n=1 Tax=Methylocystis iwaonis TaxID=2885079 RepID=UPI002E7C29ED|nr:hypothetical protein [Methylocystis iwaonis]